LLVHQFPRTYGSNFADNYYFQAIVDGSAFGVHSVRLRHRGDVRDTTDGFGTMVTPLGTYDALRVKTTEYSIDSVWVRLFAIAPWTLFDVFLDTTVSYSWLAKETKLALAEMTLDSVGAPARFTFSSIPPAVTTGQHLDTQGEEPRLFPVPARHRIHLVRSEAFVNEQAEVYTLDGRLVDSRRLDGYGPHEWDVSGWASGTYLMRLVGAHTAGPRVLRMVVE
jgi:hypothetical protein